MIVMLIAYPFVVHWAVIGGGDGVVWTALMIPALAALLPFLRRRAPWAWAGAAAAAALAGWLVQAGMASCLLYLPPVLINLMLLAFFSRGLFGPGPALITRMAEKMREQPLPAHVVTYTRHVTWMWAALFALMALVNFLLALLAPRELWSLFSNFINYIILASVFIGEYVFRCLRFPEHDHPGLLAFLRRISRIDYRRLG